MNKKSRIIILSILILLTISTLLYVSYGYIISKVEGNETAKKLSAVAKILEIEYSGGNETLSTDGEYFIPGSVLTKTFTIKNQKKTPYEKGRVKVDFKIELVDVSVSLNGATTTFNRPQDLRYELYLGDKLISDDIFPAEDSVIAFNQTIDVDETLNYTLKVYYDKTEENQIDDQGKVITAKLYFEEEPAIKNIKVLGNSYQDNTVAMLGSSNISLLSNNNSSKIQNVGDKVVNLYTEENMSEGYILSTENWCNDTTCGINSIVVSNSEYNTTDFIELTPGATYTISIINNGDTPSTVKYHIIDAGKVIIGYEYYNLSTDIGETKNRKYTLSSSQKYMRFSIKKSDNVTIIIEKNDESTDLSLFGKYNVRIIEKGLGKNLLELDNHFVPSGSTWYTKYEDYWRISTDVNTGGINFTIDEKFEVGDKVSFQAKVNFISSADSSYGDSVTLRIWNVNKKTWLNCGANGYETAASTKIFNTPKLLKCNGVPLTSSNYTKGDILQANISRGLGKLGNNHTVFDIYPDTIMFEKGSTCSEYEPYIVKTHNIYLDEPLRKVGDTYDYIDFASKKVVRNVEVVDESATTIETAYSALSEPKYEDNEYIPKLAEVASYANLELRTDLESDLIIEY